MSKGNRDNNNYQPVYPPSKNAKGFSAALLLGLSPGQSSMFEMSDGVGDTQRLNTSASAVQGDMSSCMMNDFITADLMQKIEQLSPISPNQQIKTRMSDVIMINCEDNNNLSSSRSSANSGLYSDTSEELELKEDENTKKRNKKGGNNNNEDSGGKAGINVNNSSQQQQQRNMLMMITHNKMKNFEKKFNKSFCAGDKGSNSNSNNNEHGLLFNQHSHSIGGFSSNNNNNKSQVYSYYDSTSRYLSQVLQGEEIEKNESKACDSLNNSNNYIPKNFLGLGNNANLSGSNSTTSYNIEPFNKSDKDRNSNSIFDNINANNIHEFTSGQYSTQFQHQLNNQFDLWMNNNTNNNNTSNSNSNNKDNNNNNNAVNKVILQNIMHQQRTPVTAISNTNENNNNNNNNGNVVDNNNNNNNVFTNPFIFESRPPPIQTLPPPLPPFPNTNPFANPLALNVGNNLMNYFAQMQMIQQKNYIDYTNALYNNNNPPTSTNPFPRRDKVTSSSSLNNIDSTNDNNNNTNHKEVNTKQQQHIPTTKKSKQKDEPKEYLLEMFGRIGWICNKCNNFNYETRNRCNRCSADKDPRKLSDIHKKNKDKDESNQSKKKNKEQKADWVCPNCSNLNFGFRKICNRCQIPKAQTQ